MVGKLWVPKYGDAEEFPLTPDEVDALKRYFNTHIAYPELLFFRMISVYLVRGRLMFPFTLLDDLLYKVSYFRKHSYRQYLYLS